MIIRGVTYLLWIAKLELMCPMRVTSNGLPIVQCWRNFTPFNMQVHPNSRSSLFLLLDSRGVFEGAKALTVSSLV